MNHIINTSQYLLLQSYCVSNWAGFPDKPSPKFEHSRRQYLGSVCYCCQVQNSGNACMFENSEKLKLNIFRSAMKVCCRIIGSKYTEMYDNLISDMDLHYFDKTKTPGRQLC